MWYLMRWEWEQVLGDVKEKDGISGSAASILNWTIWSPNIIEVQCYFNIAMAWHNMLNFICKIIIIIQYELEKYLYL